MVKGWQKIDGRWYYFLNSGSMVTGTQTIDGKKYAFSSSGTWVGANSSEKAYRTVLNALRRELNSKGYVRTDGGYCRGYTDLIAEMKAAGIKGKRGKPIERPAIHEILRIEKYTGVYR